MILPLRRWRDTTRPGRQTHTKTHEVCRPWVISGFLEKNKPGLYGSCTVCAHEKMGGEIKSLNRLYSKHMFRPVKEH